MITQSNVFVRKFGDHAVVITITDWKQFEDLMEKADEGNDSPDFMMAGTISKSIYSNMFPSMNINTEVAEDITESTKGAGLGGILTSPIWSYRTVKDPLLGGMISDTKDLKITDEA